MSIFLIYHRSTTCCTGCCCTIDIWGIALNIVLQDAPFLTFRLLIIIHYKIISYMNVFFTCKHYLYYILRSPLLPSNSQCNRQLQTSRNFENSSSAHNYFVLSSVTCEILLNHIYILSQVASRFSNYKYQKKFFVCWRWKCVFFLPNGKICLGISLIFFSLFMFLRV